jgi:hypothetical protein
MWKAFASSDLVGGDAPAADWYMPAYDDSLWVAPVFVSRATTDDLGVAVQEVWGVDGGNNAQTYAYFRTAVCSITLPDFDRFDMSPSSGETGSRNVGDDRLAVCDITSLVVTDLSVCQTTGEWSAPTGCQSTYSTWEEDNPNLGSAFECDRAGRTFSQPARVWENSFVDEISYGGSTLVSNLYVSHGVLDMYFSGTSVTVTISEVVMVDNQCATSGVGSDALSCVMQIRSGTDCSDVSYNTGEPWLGPGADSNAWSSIKVIPGLNNVNTVDFGYTYEETVGRTVVLHNKDGTPQACFVIERQDRTTTTASVRTSVADFDLAFGETFVEIGWENQVNLDPNCVNLGPDLATPFSCVIAVHEGFSSGSPGIPLYRNTIADPWGSVTYSSYSGFHRVENCQSFRDHLGRVLVVYNRNGNIEGSNNIIDSKFTPETTLNWEMDAANTQVYPNSAGCFSVGRLVVTKFENTDELVINYADADFVNTNCGQLPFFHPSSTSNVCRMKLFDDTCANIETASELFNPFAPFNIGSSWHNGVGSGSRILISDYTLSMSSATVFSIAVSDSTGAWVACIDQKTVLAPVVDGTSTVTPAVLSLVSFVMTFFL